MTIEATYPSEAARKSVKEKLSREYEVLSRTHHAAFCKVAHALLTDEARNEYFASKVDVTSTLAHYRTAKHYDAVAEYSVERADRMEELSALYTELKAAKIVKPLSRKAIEEKRLKEFGTHVADAVAPLRAQAVKEALAHSNRLVEFVKAELARTGGDNQQTRDTTLPYSVDKKYRLLSSLTSEVGEVVDGVYTKTDVLDTRSVERLIKNGELDAVSQYDAFVWKLRGKIGDVTAATLTGNYVWDYSILTVTREDGSTENWKTNMITNFSVYGKAFAQFPTRKMK
jgi:hypothetical protein